jgi:hypothetical protein
MNDRLIKALSLLCLMFLLSSPVKAQTHPCGGGPGPNEVQVGEDPGGNGVAPTPICNWMNDNQTQGPQRPAMHWASQWGAIATDAPKGILGVVTGQPSKSEAQQAAMADCRAKGGAPCKFEIAYDNECAAMVVGSNGYNVGSDRTVEKAAQLGMKICTTAKNTNCHVYYSGCSTPILIQ